MKILAIDIGTGTQDILLANTELNVENSFKIVAPSPTMIIHRKIKAATKAGKDILITGVMMGGGPSTWAAMDHLKAGYKIYASIEAATTFDDDLEKVKRMGIEIIDNSKMQSLPDDVIRIEFKDFDYDAIVESFSQFGVSLDDIDVIAICVFDHGFAPPNYSDRQFRFDYLAKQVEQDPVLENFAFVRKELPGRMTRMSAIAKSCEKISIPLVFMDTATAALLGSTFESNLKPNKPKLLVNIGNMHTIASIISDGKILSLFEHHTGEITSESLENLLVKMASNKLKHEEVFGHHGHGALSVSDYEYDLYKNELELIVVGPRRNLMKNTNLKPIYATPFGDMMLTGCYGLIAAAGKKFPRYSKEIQSFLISSDVKLAPWDI